MNGKTVIIVLGFLLALGWYAVRRAQLADNESVLVIGTAAGYAPFVSINAQGDYEGFDVDVARLLAARLGKKLVLKDLGTMTSLMIALNQGTIDAIIWGVDITQDRLKKYVMVAYQGEKITTNPLVFWKRVPAGIKTLADMKGRTVCIEPASSQSALVRKYPDIIALPVDKVDDALVNIQYGKADAALLDPPIAKKFKAAFPEIQLVDIPLDEEDQTAGIGIVLLPGSKCSLQIQEAIEQLKSNNALALLEKKWGLT